MDRVLLAGIGTDVGKTLVAAVLVETLGWDYWKPISAAPNGEGDTARVQQLVSRKDVAFHSEAYSLCHALSPHAAARLENVFIDANSIRHEETANTLLVEMAGGVLVPINNQTLLIDVLAPLCSRAILVCRHYLGSINHTLLSVEALQQRGVHIEGVIFNGETAPYSEDFILEYTGLRCLARLQTETEIHSSTIQRYASRWKNLQLSLSPMT